jgi:hypothetical protein
LANTNSSSDGKLCVGQSQVSPKHRGVTERVNMREKLLEERECEGGRERQGQTEKEREG